MNWGGASIAAGLVALAFALGHPWGWLVILSLAFLISRG